MTCAIFMIISMVVEWNMKISQEIPGSESPHISMWWFVPLPMHGRNRKQAGLIQVASHFICHAESTVCTSLKQKPIETGKEKYSSIWENNMCTIDYILCSIAYFFSLCLYEQHHWPLISCAGSPMVTQTLNLIKQSFKCTNSLYACHLFRQKYLWSPAIRTVWPINGHNQHTSNYRPSGVSSQFTVNGWSTGGWLTDHGCSWTFVDNIAKSVDLGQNRQQMVIG